MESQPGRSPSLDAAVAAQRRACESHPEDEQAHLVLATTLARGGDRAGAFAVLDAFAELHPGEAVARHLEAMLRNRSPRTEFDPMCLPAPAGAKSPATVAALAFDPGERTLAAGTRGGDLWLYSLDSEGSSETAPVLRGRVPRGVSALAFSPDGKTLVSGGGDQTIRLWEVHSSARGETVAQKLEGFVFGVSCYRGGICGASFQSVWIRDAGGTEHLDLFRGNLKLVLPRPWCDPAEAARQNRRLGYGWSDPTRRPEGGWATTATFSGLGGHRIEGPVALEVLAEATGTCVGLLMEGRIDLVAPDDSIRSYRHPEIFPVERLFFADAPVASLAPHGLALATGSIPEEHFEETPGAPYQRGARLFLLGDEVRSIELLPEEEVTAVAFSPSGERLALGTRTGTVHLVDVFR